MSAQPNGAPAPETAPAPLVVNKKGAVYSVTPADVSEDAEFVTGLPDDPQCSCIPFLETGAICRHIEEVQKIESRAKPKSLAPAPRASAPPTREMTLKRSVSPDGRIDSLSIEFSVPIDGFTSEQVLETAVRGLAAQHKVAEVFLARSGQGKPTQESSSRPTPSPSPRGVPARITEVGETKTRYGLRPVLFFEVAGEKRRMFGKLSDLQAAIRNAGYPEEAKSASPGAKFDLRCRVELERSGEYENVVRVFPEKGGSR